MKGDVWHIVGMCLIAIIILGIYYCIAVSDLPEWFKFYLLK